jgi:hypothetical protein
MRDLPLQRPGNPAPHTRQDRRDQQGRHPDIERPQRAAIGQKPCNIEPEPAQSVMQGSPTSPSTKAMIGTSIAR